MIQDITLRISPKKSSLPELLRNEIASVLKIGKDEINDYRILRRSIDARRKTVMVNLNVRVATGDNQTVHPIERTREFRPVASDAEEVVIVGAGPAGLFAALKAIEVGLRPIVLERGKDVDSRRMDLAKISREGVVDVESNYCFGEGGAGTYSDGKLFTRSKKRGNVEEVLQILHQHGASRDILIDSHPHIGSDRLPQVIKNIRQTIINAGGIVKFCTKVVDLIIEDGEAKGVVAADGEKFMGPVVLATGHSARDIYRMLKNHNIALEAKGLAVGMRLEHPQNTIDVLQYHMPDGRGKYLPAAEYNFVTQVDGRGVYSFCMCPGGVVVPSMTGDGQCVVNGMSASARASKWANSAIVVELHPGDIPGFSKHEELEMMYLQEALEKRFFEATGTLKAPAQRMTDFTEGIRSETLPRTSYAPGIESHRVDQLLPDEISRRMQEAFRIFNRKCQGFLTNDAVLVGLESRTSSPVRIPRKNDTLRHIEIRNLYPAGEGAGYAGGIVSAAIDGQRCIQAYINDKNS